MKITQSAAIEITKFTQIKKLPEIGSINVSNNDEYIAVQLALFDMDLIWYDNNDEVRIMTTEFDIAFIWNDKFNMQCFTLRPVSQNYLNFNDYFDYNEKWRGMKMKKLYGI